MATKTFTGEISFIHIKEGEGQRGPWKAYSAKITKEDGEEYDEWVNFGFKKPPCAKGDSVVITTVKEKGFWVAKDVEVTAKAKEVDSDEEDSESGKTGTKGQSASSAPQASSGPNKDQRIQYQHSQDMGIRLASLLLANKAVPLTATAGKAGEAARYEEVVALVNKLTVALNNDVATGRLVRDIEDAYEAPAEAEAGFDGEEEGEEDDE